MEKNEKQMAFGLAVESPVDTVCSPVGDELTVYDGEKPGQFVKYRCFESWANLGVCLKIFKQQYGYPPKRVLRYNRMIWFRI